MSARGNAIIDLIRSDPDGWHFGRHTADHRASGLRLWIANFQPFDLDIQPGNGGNFSLWDKWRIWRALNDARVLQAVRRARNATLKDADSAEKP